MKTRYSVFTAFFSILLFVAGQAQACGPSIYSNEGRLLLFRNGLDGLSSLEPFYYSENFLNTYAPDPEGKDYERNCLEWRNFTGGKAGVNDIYAIQYQTGASDFLDACASGNRRFFGNNSFMNWLLLKENKAALEYMILAKKAELTQFGNGDPWEETISTSPVHMSLLAHEAAGLCATVKSTFLKERYAFQALKMAYYAGSAELNRPAIMALYQQYLEKSNSVVLGWAQLFYGMQLSRREEQTLYLLQSFDNSEEKKVFCYQYISRATLDSLLPIIKDKHILELIYVMKALKSYGRAFDAISKIYNLNPQSKYLPLLLTREINKLEDWIWSPELLGFNGISFDEDTVKRAPFNKAYSKEDSGYVYYARKNLEKDKLYLNEVRSFMESAALKNSSNKAFLQLCIAHLYNVTGDYNQALRWVNDMEKMRDKQYEIQRLIESTIAFSNTEDITTKQAKYRIAVNLQQLEQLNPGFRKRMQQDPGAYYYDGGDEVDEHDDDIAELLLLLSNRYKLQGDILTAGLLYNKASISRNIYDGWADTSTVNYRLIAYFDREGTPQIIDSLLAFMHKEHSSDFDQFLIPKRWAKEDFYKDLKGTILVRQKKYKEALLVFNSIDARFWQDNYEYKNYLPRTSVTYLGTLTPWEDKDKAVPYAINSKKLILEEVTGIIDSLEHRLKPEIKAALQYRLGNALYSFSYYGKAWMMMSYGRTSRETWSGAGNFAYYSFYPNTLRYGNNYYGCSDAMAAYNKALALTHNKELQAKCLLNLALCDKNASAFHFTLQNKYRDLTSISPFLRRLEEQFSHTAAYETATIYCPDIGVSPH